MHYALYYMQVATLERRVVTGQNRVEVTIDCLYKVMRYRFVPKRMTLNDF